MWLRQSLLFKIVLLSWTISVTMVTSMAAAPPICCFPQQFESLMFGITTGQESYKLPGNGLGIAYGTINTAYDVINKRTYMCATHKLANIPALAVNITLLQDYKNNVVYEEFLGFYCDEGPINDDLLIECIPEGAEVVSVGTLGDSSTQVVSYFLNATILGFDYQLVVSVIHTDKFRRECMPVRISLTDNPPDQTSEIVVTDVVDVTKGIKDTAIFNPPRSCKNATEHQTFGTV